MCNKIAPEIPVNCNKNEADEDENQEEVASKGLGWFTTAIFVGRAGAGIVALPAAVVKCQFYPGLLIVGLMATLLTSTAVLLGKCWEIVLRRFPEYASFHCRKPYAEIAFRAMGPHMRAIISIFVNFSQFGMTTVFLLLSAKNTRDFLIASFDFDIDYCILLILIALFLLPFIQLRSPCSFWPIIIVAMCCSVAAISLICFGILSDAKKCAPIREFPEFSAQNYLNALGTMLFAYGGHPGYPTIQHDMKNPKDFTKSAILGFSIMSFFNYTAICLAGLVYGNSVRDCVLNSIQTQWIQHLANLSIACHCFCSITLLINPVNQELEEYFRIPHEFGWKRILLRSIVLFAVVFVAESVPSFGPVLNLYAGITVAFSAAIFPCLFYLYLSAGEQRAKEQPALNKKQIAFSEVVSRTPRCRLLYCCTLMVLFALIAISATITAANSMFNYNFVRPCYAQFIFPNIAPTPIPPGHSHSATNCCGPFQNISRYGPSLKFCTAPELAYYG